MRFNSLTDRAGHRRALRRWNAALEQADTLSRARLEAMSEQAQELRVLLDRFIRRDGNGNGNSGGKGLMPPMHSDWSWRPPLWEDAQHPAGTAAPESGTELAAGVKVFHDCPLNQIILRQLDGAHGNTGHPAAPYAQMLEVLGFEGSFLSLVFDLPVGAVAGLRDSHVLSLAASVNAERPLRIYARLNIRHGPNTEQIVREFPAETIAAGGEGQVEFDLAYADFHQRRVDHMWLDLIFDSPAMSRVLFRDLLFSRRPRAEL